MRLIILLSFACILSAHAQIDLVQSKAQSFPAGTFVQVELNAVPSEGNLLIAFLGSPSDSSNHFFPTESGWTFLTDEISNARLHVFYKIAGASENKKKTFLTPHVNSNYTAILAEYGNAGSIAGFVTNSSEDQVNLLPFGPVNALTGQRAVVAFVARQLSTDEIVWSDDFEARASVTVDPEGSPLGSAMSDFLVTDNSEIQTTASWAPLAEPGGILLLLSEELITYDISFTIRDEAAEPLSGATVTFNGVRKEAGEYTVTGIRSGTYDYMVEKEGYLTYKGRVTVVEDGTEDVLLYALTPGKYYVSAGGNDSNPGNTPRAPWKTIDKVRTFSFQTGDDVYFRCGDTFIPSDRFYIGWEGTEEDPVIIGAYYMNGETAVHDVNENGRPVLSGNNYMSPTLYSSSIIKIVNKDYIHIKDLHLYQSGGHGIDISGDYPPIQSQYFLIQNVKIEGALNGGILINKNGYSYGVIEGCEVSGTNYGWKIGYQGVTGWGGTIVVAHSPFAHIKIRNNYLHENWGEGFIVWRNPNNSQANNSGYVTIEDNIVWNNRRVDIYIEGTEHNIVRRNICLGSNDSRCNFNDYRADGRCWNQMGIWVNSEIYDEGHNPAKNNHVYNNLVAGHNTGIGLAAERAGETMSNNVFYNNTVIDNRFNWSVGDNLGNYITSGVEFKNNISLCTDGAFCQNVRKDQYFFDSKFTGRYNAWTGSFPVYMGDSGTDKLISDDDIASGMDFQDINEEDLQNIADQFKLAYGSDLIDAGTALDPLYNSDFFGNTRPAGNGWDIGAHEYPSVVNVGSVVGISAFCKLYPNPSSGNINIEFEITETSNVNIKIYDIIGTEITSFIDQEMVQGKHIKSFEIDYLEKGIYLLRFRAGKRHETFYLGIQ